MIIIQDTREKIPWNFLAYNQCKGQVRRGIPTGDYTVEGYEDLVVVERKRNTAELALNLGRKRDAFRRELERMSDYRFKYIVCEFSADDIFAFPKNSGMPPKAQAYCRMNGKFIFSRLQKWAEEFEIAVYLCKDTYEAERQTLWLLAEAVRIIDEEKRDSSKEQGGD